MLTTVPPSTHIVVPLVQGTPAWHAWRAEGIGGSDMGALILGDEWPYRDSRDDFVWESKVLGKKLESNYAMRRGSRLEDSARQLAQTRLRSSFPPACVQHAENPWMRVSLDGFAGDELLEIKCPNWVLHGQALEGWVPRQYRPQCYYQLLTTGAQKLWYCSYSEADRYVGDDQLALAPVTLDPEVAAAILEVGEAFWEAAQAARAELRQCSRGRDANEYYWKWREYRNQRMEGVAI